MTHLAHRFAEFSFLILVGVFALSMAAVLINATVELIKGDL